KIWLYYLHGSPTNSRETTNCGCTHFTWECMGDSTVSLKELLLMAWGVSADVEYYGSPTPFFWLSSIVFLRFLDGTARSTCSPDHIHHPGNRYRPTAFCNRRC